MEFVLQIAMSFRRGQAGRRTFGSFRMTNPAVTDYSNVCFLPRMFAAIRAQNASNQPSIYQPTQSQPSQEQLNQVQQQGTALPVQTTPSLRGFNARGMQGGTPRGAFGAPRGAEPKRLAKSKRGKKKTKRGRGAVNVQDLALRHPSLSFQQVAPLWFRAERI